MPCHSNFTIEKLQDAYDCDLDLRDTVSSIFGGETDATMRMIKVVPSFRDRHFSVPVTSNLRPVDARKRTREVNGESANKRRRTEQLAEVQEDIDPTRDQPVPSTERSEHGSQNQGFNSSTRAASHQRRSHTANSIVFIHDFPTRRPELAVSVKEEPPELSPPPFVDPSHDTEPNVPHANGTNKAHSDGVNIGRRSASMQTGRVNGIAKPVEDAAEDAYGQSPHDQVHTHTRAEQELEPESEPEPEDNENTAVLRSRQPTPVPPQPTNSKRRDVYDVPSSPEFLSYDPKPKTTYGRSPRTTTTVQKELSLLNNSRVSAIRPPLSSQSSSKKPQPQTPQSAPPKRGRGRPRKSSITQPEGSAKPERATKKPAKASTLTPGIPKKRGRPPKQIATEVKDTHDEASADPESSSKEPIPPVNDKLPENQEQSKQNETSSVHAATPSMEAGLSASNKSAKATEKEPPKEVSPAQSAAPLADTALTTNDKSTETNEASPKAVPWNSESWGFGNLTQPNGQPNGTASETSEDPQDDPPANHVSSGAVEGASSPEPSAPPAVETNSKSRSRSAADSVRSSPAVTRRPARFLSRSPSQGSSGSDNESEGRSASRSNPASPQPAPPNAVASQSESSSESEESSTEDDDDEEDIEMPDAPTDAKANATASTAPQTLPSSPPHHASTATPTPADARPSQPTLSQITQPTPASSRPPLSQAPHSSQSISAQAAARRPVSRYTSFRSIREQLEDTKAATPTVHKKAYDPRTAALNKLTGKGPGALGDDESSDDESSSSSSDSD
jgi:hypothetical protein